MCPGRCACRRGRRQRAPSDRRRRRRTCRRSRRRWCTPAPSSCRADTRYPTTFRGAALRRWAQTTTQCRRRTSSWPVVFAPPLRSTRTVFGWWWDSAPWMSLKTLFVRGRSLLQRAPAARPWLRVLPLLVASKVAVRARACRSFTTIRSPAVIGSFGTRRRVRRDDEATPPATADLAAFPACVTGFVCGPLMGRALFVRRPPPFARDLPLLFGGHRREPSSLFAF